MPALYRIVDPAVTPLSLAEVKAHLRVSSTDQDNLITLYLKAATDYVDGEKGFLGIALVTQTWRMTLDAFPTTGLSGNAIKIPLPPLQSVVGVNYYDGSGAPQIVPSANYYVDNQNEPGWIVPVSSWPATLNAINAVSIDFVAGYIGNDSPPDLTAAIPYNIKAGLLLLIGTMMEYREENADKAFARLPFGADILLRRHKIDKSMA